MNPQVRVTDKTDIIKRALSEIKRLKAELKSKTKAELESFAVIGMACRFPGGIQSPDAYWQALVDQQDMVRECPEERWPEYSKEKLLKNPFLKKAGFLREDIGAFDHRLFRFSPKEAERSDPQQRLFLKVCWEALENSGYVPNKLTATKTGIYAGVSVFDHIQRLYLKQKEVRFEPQDVTGSCFSFISGRVSYFFGFQGPAITTDTACSSSLVAVDQACKALVHKDCDMALAGGVNLLLSPETTELMATLNVLSPDCQIRSFDASANGTVRGEGCGVVVLKRLADAERDEDHVHAVIVGSGANQDGLSSGMTVPYGPAQEKLIVDVWHRAGIDSEEIDFVETHGTGTNLGDPIEIEALGNVIDKDRASPLYIGAVKTAIGHLEAAAGIAGLIKAILAVERGAIPGNLHFHTPSPHINWDDFPMQVPTETIPWVKANGERTAAVSSFGLSGTNAHVVVKEYKKIKKDGKFKGLNNEQIDITDASKRWPFRFSAMHQTGLKDQLRKFLKYIENSNAISMGDLSYSQNISRAQLKEQMVIWSPDRSNLVEQLKKVLQGKRPPEIQIRRPQEARKKVVFLFCGSRSQYPQMFYDFYQENPLFRKYMDRCNEIYLDLKGIDLLPIIFSNGQELNKIRYAQVALFVVEYSLARMWVDYGVVPSYMIGHSLGEYVAACVAGVFDLNNGIRFITARAELIENLPKTGKMVALGESAKKVSQRLAGMSKISIAAINTPKQTVVSGDVRKVDALTDLLKSEGIIAHTLEGPFAFHSSLMVPMVSEFEALSKKINFRSPRIRNLQHHQNFRIISNVTGKTVGSEIANCKYWLQHLLAPVRFSECVQSIDSLSDYLFLEVGPGRLLTQMVEAISRGKSTCLVSNERHEKTSSRVDKTLFHLANSGLDIHWKIYYQGSGLKKISVPNFAFREKHFSLDLSAHRNELSSDPDQAQGVGYLPSAEPDLDQVNAYVRVSLIREWKAEGEVFTDNENLLLRGLDSITMGKLIGHWSVELSLPLRAALFLEKPTIAHWSKLILKRIQSRESVSLSLTDFQTDELNRFEPFELSDVQHAYWVGRNKEIPWGGFGCYGYLEFNTKKLDPLRFRHALKQLIERHDMLRVTITVDGHQKILPILDYQLRVYKRETTVDLTSHLETIKREMSSQTIPLGKPLFDLRLSEIKKEMWRIHFGVDFIASDALSINIFWRDLYKLYNGETLPKIDVSFRDYVNYISRRKKEPRYQIDKDYWLSRVGSFPEAPKLPLIRMDIPDEPSAPRFVHREKSLPKKEWKLFVRSAAKRNLTPSAAVMAIFSEILSGWGAGRHFGLVLTVFNRDKVHPQIDDVIGDFTQLSLLSVTRENRSIGKNAEALQRQMQEDLAHTSFCAVEVVKEINKTRKTAAIYPVVFTSALGVSDDYTGFGNKRLFGEAGIMTSQTPQVWFDAQLLVKNGKVCVSWDTVDHIFPPGMIDAMFAKYLELIERAIKEQSFWQTTLVDLRIPSQKSVHASVNNTTMPLKECLLHEPIIHVSKRDPERTAIVFKDEKYTFFQLISRADQVSECLQAKGVKRGDHVAIQMAKSFDMIAIVLGIVQFGAVYIPISRDNPPERTSEILKKSDARCFFADQTLDVQNVNVKQLTIADLDGFRGHWKKVRGDSKDTGYIMYTSGSSGTPKGVVIKHEAAINTIQDVNRRFNITRNDCVLGISSLSFDLSVYDVFGVLGMGGKLIVPTEDERIDPKSWWRLSKQNQVTLWNTVPALLGIYLEFLLTHKERKMDPCLKHVFLSGDWIPLSIHEKIKQALPNAKLVSMGGATEASIWSNYFEVQEIEKEWNSIPYGYPLANQSFYVLDECSRPCPDWVKGRLHIAGKSLAKGYLADEALTDRSFFLHPNLNLRLYNTGDYGRYKEGGLLEFLGREDDQLKINGYRVEIGEIQAGFAKCHAPPDPIILAIGEKAESKKLIAFVRTNPTHFSESELKKQLAYHLPPYFIPEKIIALLEYPKTANGKIDRSKLIQCFHDVLKPTLSTPSAIDVDTDDHPVLNVVREVFQLPELNVNEDFSNLGVSSMDIIHLANQLEVRFSSRPAVGEMIRYTKVSDFIAYYQTQNIEFDSGTDMAPEINQGFGHLSAEQIEHLQQLDFIEDPEDREDYKRTHTSQRQGLQHHGKVSLLNISEDGASAANGPTNHDELYVSSWIKKKKPSIQKKEPIPFAAFRDYLSLCYSVKVANKHYFRYDSSDEIYPVQAYVSIGKMGIETIEDGGAYFFDNRSCELVKISDAPLAVPDTTHRPEEEKEVTPSIAIHFVADMNAIYPIYGRDSLRQCFMECGAIYQLLQSQGARFNIASRRVEAGEEFSEAVKNQFNLSPRYVYLDSITAETIDFKKERREMHRGFAAKGKLSQDDDVIQTLLEKCKRHGVKLWVENTHLKFKAPETAMTGTLKKELKLHKKGVIQCLNQGGVFHQKNSSDGELFPLTPIQWAYVSGRGTDFELGNVGAHYYAEIECRRNDAQKMEPVINEIIACHEALRTVVYADGMQQVLKEVPYYKLDVSEIKNESEIEKIRKAWSHRMYELGNWPMFHFRISHLENGRSRLHISVDLLIMDAWSGDQMLNEIFRKVKGSPVAAPEFSFRDYIRKEKIWHQKNKYFFEKAKAYWQEKIDTIPPAPALPYRKPLSHIKRPRFKRWKFELSKEAIQTLALHSRQYHLSPTAVFFTAFMKLLSAWSKNQNLTVNMTLFNRLPLHKEAMNILGDFTNIALISFFTKEQVTFLEEVKEIQDQLWQAVEHRAYSGLDLLRELSKKTPGKATMPIVFTSLLGVDTSNRKKPDFPNGVREVFAISQTPQVVLDHHLYQRGGNYIVNWDVVEDAFEIKELDTVFGLYKGLIQRIMADKNWDVPIVI